MRSAAAGGRHGGGICGMGAPYHIVRTCTYTPGSCSVLLAYRISRKDFPAGSRAGFTTDREIVRLIRRADPARIRLEIMGLIHRA